MMWGMEFRGVLFRSLGRRSAEARVGLAGDKEAQARLDKLDASLLTLTHRSANPNISIEGAARAAAEISALELQLDKLGSKSAPGATSALSGLAGTGGMGALIAAGVALSPVIITLGTGLAGLAVAGYSTNRKSTRLNSSHQIISYSLFSFKKKNNNIY